MQSSLQEQAKDLEILRNLCTGLCKPQLSTRTWMVHSFCRLVFAPHHQINYILNKSVFTFRTFSVIQLLWCASLNMIYFRAFRDSCLMVTEACHCRFDDVNWYQKKKTFNFVLQSPRLTKACVWVSNKTKVRLLHTRKRVHENELKPEMFHLWGWHLALLV